MLVEIKVKNFAIIEELSFDLKSGLNIISGETGSGKSIVLKSLALLMGDKASSDTVRTGAEQAIIEGYFDLSKRKDILKKLNEMSLEGDEDELVARRVISSQGKSKVYLNGHLSTLNNLKEIVAPLVEINGFNPPLIELTGQHESKALLEKAYHLDLLDQVSGCSILRKEFEEKFHLQQTLLDQLEVLKEKNLHKEQRLDFLYFQQKEITEIGVSENFEKEIEENYLKAKNFHSLSAYVSKLEDEIYSGDNSIIDRLQLLVSEGENKFRTDNWMKKLDMLATARTQLEEFVFDIREWQRDLIENPIDIEKAESRMSQWRKLQKKYGDSSNEILSVLKKINDEIEQLENFDQKTETLEKEIEEIKKWLLKTAETLHKERTKASVILTKKVNEELKDLNMKGVQFGIQIQKLSESNSKGVSDVEFAIQVSKEDKFRPLNKIASGGELSRILLSLKKVTCSSEQPRTYLFDEVDTGVSGETAEKVGAKLKAISTGQQVVCVTHLPQVAVFADSHFVISKIQSGKKVGMQVVRLNSQQQEEEIARLISGTKVTTTSRKHARQLLNETRDNI